MEGGDDHHEGGSRKKRPSGPDVVYGNRSPPKKRHKADPDAPEVMILQETAWKTTAKEDQGISDLRKDVRNQMSKATFPGKACMWSTMEYFKRMTSPSDLTSTQRTEQLPTNEGVVAAQNNEMKRKPESQAKIQTSMTSRPPAGIEANIVPVRDIKRDLGTFKIRVSVTRKSEIIHYTTGKRFDMNLSDQSGNIRMTGFNQAVDMFYTSFQVGKMYCISNFFVTDADPKFNTTSHQFEVRLSHNTVVEDSSLQVQDNLVASESLP